MQVSLLPVQAMQGREHGGGTVKTVGQNTKAAVVIGLHLVVYGSFAMGLGVSISLLSLALASVLIWISAYDFETFEIPDTAQIALLGVGLWSFWAGYGPGLADRIIGGIAWAVIVWSVALGYERVRGWDGLGFGDVKLMGGIGFLLGFQPVIPVLGVAAATAAASLILIWLLRGAKTGGLGKSAVAFGPFLCLSTWAIWLLEVRAYAV